MGLSPLYAVGAGLVGDLFKKGNGQADMYQGQADSALNGIRTNADSSQNVGNVETGAGLDDLASYKNARANYFNRLNQPVTNQQNAAQIAQGLGSANTMASRYRSELSANLAHRGLQTADSGGVSGSLAGGEASILNNMYGVDSAARERSNEMNVQRADQAAQTIAGTYGQDSGNEIGRGQSAYGSANSGYDTYAGQKLGEAATATAATNAYNGGIDQFTSGIGTYLGGLGGGVKVPAKANPLSFSSAVTPSIDPANYGSYTSGTSYGQYMNPWKSNIWKGQ